MPVFGLSSSSESASSLSMNSFSSAASSSPLICAFSSSSSSSSSALSPMAPQFTFGTSVSTGHYSPTFPDFPYDPYHQPAFGFWSEFPPPASYYDDDALAGANTEPCEPPWDSDHPYPPFIPSDYFYNPPPAWEPSAPTAADYWTPHWQPDIPHHPSSSAIAPENWNPSKSFVEQTAPLERPLEGVSGFEDCGSNDGREKKITQDDVKYSFGERWRSFQEGSLFQKQHSELYTMEQKSGPTNCKNINSKETRDWKCKPQCEGGKQDGLSFEQFSGNEGNEVAVSSILSRKHANYREINANSDSLFSKSHCSTMGVSHDCNGDSRMSKEIDTNTCDKEWDSQVAGCTVLSHSAKLEPGSKHTANIAAVEDIASGPFMKQKGRDVGTLQKPGGVSSDEVLLDTNNDNMKKHKPNVTPSNGRHTIVTTVYNLSKVLAKMLAGQSINAGDDCIDMLQQSICVLSHCLLKQLEPTFETSKPDFANETKSNIDWKQPGRAKTSINQECHEGEFEGLHSSRVSNIHPEDGEIEETKHRMTMNDDKRSKGRASQVLKKHNDNLSLQAYMDKSQKELAQLQAVLKRLHEEVSYERSESTAVNEMYKSVWEEAEDKLTLLVSEVKEIKLEVEYLKQRLESQKCLGCTPSDANAAGDLSIESSGLTENLGEDSSTGYMLGSSGRMARRESKEALLSDLDHSLQELEKEDEATVVGNCRSLMDTEQNGEISPSMKQGKKICDLLQASANQASSSENSNDSKLVIGNDMLSRFHLLQQRHELEKHSSNQAFQIENSIWLPFKNDVFSGVRADMSKHDKQDRTAGTKPVFVEPKICQLSQSKAETVNVADINLSSCLVSQDAANAWFESSIEEASLPGYNSVDEYMMHDSSLLAERVLEESEEREFCGTQPSSSVGSKDQSQKALPTVQLTASRIYTRLGEINRGIEGESDWEHILPLKG